MFSLTEVLRGVGLGLVLAAAVFFLNDTTWKPSARTLQDVHRNVVIGGNKNSNNRWNSISDAPLGGTSAEVDEENDNNEENHNNELAVAGVYEFIADKGCALGHTLSKQALICACGDLCDYTLYKNSTASYCGGIPMIPGHCFRPQSGTYARAPTNEHVSPLVTHTLCKTSKDVLSEGDFVSSGLSNPKSEYKAAKCEMIPSTNVAWTLLNALKGRGTRFAIMGDSHARNLMSGYLAFFRNQQYVMEAHMDFKIKDQGLIGSFHVYYDSETKTIKDTYGYGAVNHSYERLVAAAKDFCTLKELCISLIFLWAPDFRLSHELWKHMVAFDPHVLLSSISAYEQKIPLATDVEKDYIDYFNKPTTSVRQWFWFYWAYGMKEQATLPKRIEKIESLQKKFEQTPHTLPRRATIYSIADFHQRSCNANHLNRENCNQTTATWHSICGIQDTYPKEQYKFIAQENCTALLDKTFIRSFFTNYLATLSIDTAIS